MRKIILLVPALFISSFLPAQQVHPNSSARIYVELAKLDHLANVLYLAAHPDDENTRLLTWLVSDQHVNAAYLSVTRGDGGQNILGSEQGAALGLIRTHELLAARDIDHAGQFFTRAIDFGFSKSSDETLKHWNENLLTGDITWIYRKFRPDVVICRFPPTSQAGHGQHASATILAVDAFKASGDKSQYPDQLKYYSPWQPKRIFWNTFRFGNNNTTSEDQFKIRVGQYTSLLGMGYGEQAGIIRSMHKSQGAGTPSVPGTADEYFSLLGGTPVTTSLFDGIDITWNRVSRKDIGDKINQVIAGFNFIHPDASIPALLEIRGMIKTVKDNFWKEQKLAEIDKIILDCSGFLAEMVANTPEAVAGQSLPFTLNIIGRSPVPIRLIKVDWINEVVPENDLVGDDNLHSYNHTITLPENTPLTEPYWMSMPEMDDAHYTIPFDTLRGLDEAPVRLNGRVTVQIGEQEFLVDVPLSYKTNDQEKGTLVEPLRIVPGVTLDFGQTMVITQPDGSIHTALHLHSYMDMNGAVLSLKAGTVLQTIGPVNLQADKDTVLSLYIPAAILGSRDGVGYTLGAALQWQGKSYNKTQHTIRYNHIPTLQYFTPSEVKVVRSDWKCTVTKIGYVPGAGDYMLTFLKGAGFNVDILNDDDFKDANKLAQYEAIVTEVRALNVEKQMSLWMPVLLQYVYNGGTLVMQYNRVQPVATNEIGPYPLTLSNERVTEENAEVTIIDPNDKLLNYPNKITQQDFTGWVQERGLNFPGRWDDKYIPLFKMHDSGESSLEGGTLYAKYGKGIYINTSLSFFRQLPAGNKGAIRLLMNLLSAGK